MQYMIGTVMVTVLSGNLSKRRIVRVPVCLVLIRMEENHVPIILARHEAHPVVSMKRSQHRHTHREDSRHHR